MAAGAILALTLTGCATTDGGDGNTLEQAEDEGTITVAFAAEEPYGFQDDDGELVGEAPSLHKEVFDRVGGIEVEGRQFEFGSLIQALNAGEVDVVSAGMFITPERCQQASFSNPEYVAKTALMVEQGNPMNLSDFESVTNNPDARLAVMRGAVEVAQAEGAGVPRRQMEIVADQQGGFDALAAGRADAFALTDISLNWAAQDMDGVEVTESFVPVVDGEEQLGVGAAVFRDDDTELREAFNEELQALLEEEGAWLEIVEPFGFTEENKPEPDMTAEQFCQG
jgi:polar amino acid transport system substrate-binding protein